MLEEMKSVHGDDVSMEELQAKLLKAKEYVKKKIMTAEQALKEAAAREQEQAARESSALELAQAHKDVTLALEKTTKDEGIGKQKRKAPQEAELRARYLGQVRFQLTPELAEDEERVGLHLDRGHGLADFRAESSPPQVRYRPNCEKCDDEK